MNWWIKFLFYSRPVNQLNHESRESWINLLLIDNDQTWKNLSKEKQCFPEFPICEEILIRWCFILNNIKTFSCKMSVFFWSITFWKILQRNEKNGVKLIWAKQLLYRLTVQRSFYIAFVYFASTWKIVFRVINNFLSLYF